ncbi:MAG: DUF3014 domain-containing protein [Syntrophotaleaceae bacterium]
MKPFHIAALILGLLVVTLLVVFFLWPQKPSSPPVVTELERPPAAPLEAEPEIRYPLPAEERIASEEEKPARPLPALADSDPYMKELFLRLFGESSKVLVSQEFIPRMVLIIDSLPRKEYPHQHVPAQSPPGQFQVSGEAGSRVIAAENFRRYTPYVRLAEAVPSERLKYTYLTVYPLMEQAYRQLGHPKGYFHDRMIQVLDHMIDTPEVEYPLPVVQHVKAFRYADPQLESLSAGRKLLLRMGPDNSQRIRDVLLKLRNQLVGEGQQGESSSAATNS